MKKEVKEKRVLFTKHILTSPMKIGKYATQDEPILRTLATKHGLTVSGPIEHAYWNMAIEGIHILEIWLPVEGRINERSIEEMKLIKEYKCLTSDFKRPIEEIGDAWFELGEEAKKLGHQLTHHEREVYRRMDCDNPENNDIELQIGII